MKYPKLHGRIVEKCGTIKTFAIKLGMTPTTIGAKLKGRSPWKDKEINATCEILEIPREQISLYFLP